MKVIVFCWLFVSNHSTSKEPLDKARKYAHLIQFQRSAEHVSRDYTTNPIPLGGAPGDQCNTGRPMHSKQSKRREQGEIYKHTALWEAPSQKGQLLWFKNC